MEVIAKGYKTGLYQLEEAISPFLSKFNDQEIQLLEQFDRDQQQRSCRWVPVRTAVLQTHALSLEGPSLIAKMIMKAIQDLPEYKTMIEQADLETLILKDINNGDLPFLTKTPTYIYYGDTIIAEKF